MSKCAELKREFQRSYFGFNHESSRLFVLSECGPRLLYPVWTGFWLLYHLAWFAVDPYNAYKDDGNGDKYYFIFLTNWGYIFVGLSNLLDFSVTTYVLCKRTDLITTHAKSDVPVCMPWYLKIVWILFELSNTVALLITIAFYGLLTPSTKPSSIEKHAINSMYVLLNLFVCAKPIRILHIIYPVIFGVLYVVFSVIYQKGGNAAAIYKVLDWDKPGTTVMYAILLIFVGAPVIHMSLFSLHKLRIFCQERICAKTTPIDDKKQNNITMENVAQDLP